MVILAETGRIPVDNPSSTFELSMIEASRTIEYSGQELALLEWGDAGPLFVLAFRNCSYNLLESRYAMSRVEGDENISVILLSFSEEGESRS